MPSPAALKKTLADGQPAPLYLLYGTEKLLIDELVERFASLVAEGFEDFNLHHYLADETPPQPVLEQCRTLPFMAPPRVVVVRGVDAYKAEDLAAFQSYLEDPNENAVVVLTAQKTDFRLGFYKKLKENDWIVACEPPKGRGLSAWVKETARGKGFSLDEGGVRTMIDLVGSDLSDLDGELEKLGLWALDRERVSAEDVRTVVRRGATANVFELGDAVGSQDPGRALAALDDLLLTEHHLPVLAMLVRHFRLLLKVKAWGLDRGQGGDAAKALKLPPFVARKYVDQARALSLGQIKKGLARLLDVNLALVSSRGASERMIMDQLVLDLTSLKRTGSGP